MALTRAKDRLLITGWLTKQETAVAKSWYPLLEQAIAKTENAQTKPGPDWANNQPQWHLTLGNITPKTTQTKPQKPTLEPWPSWASPLPKEPKPASITNPSNNASDEPSAPSPRQTQSSTRHFGIELHRLLHQLGGLNTQERDHALTQALKRIQDQDQAKELNRQINAVLNLPELSPVFAKGSRSEQPIIGRLGNITVSGQIDRMAITDDAVMIVDFKTNRRPPKDVTKTSKTYLRQMAAYKALLSRIYPGKTIHCGLVWTQTPELHLIPPAMLDDIKLTTPGS